MPKCWLGSYFIHMTSCPHLLHTGSILQIQLDRLKNLVTANIPQCSDLRVVSLLEKATTAARICPPAMRETLDRQHTLSTEVITHVAREPNKTIALRRFSLFRDRGQCWEQPGGQ
jgi:hypothetical protein